MKGTMPKCPKCDSSEHVEYMGEGFFYCDRIGCPDEHFQRSSEPFDAVNHPAHYTSHPSGIECIQVTEHMNFNIGCAVKYCWRAGIKSEKAHVEDLRKAVWYIEREISRIEKS